MGWGKIAGEFVLTGGIGVLYDAYQHSGPDGPAGYKKPQPEGFEFPQASIGAPAPYIYGTIRVDSPVLLWHGNPDSAAGNDGFEYQITLLLTPGVPFYDKYNDPANPGSQLAPFYDWRALRPPRWKAVWWGDLYIPFAFPGMVHGEARLIGHNLGNDGALLAQGEFWDGRRDQVITAYPNGPSNTIDERLAAAGVDRSLVPGYRHKMLCVIAASGSYGSIGTSPHIPGIGLEIAAVGPEPINGLDANPAWVIFDLICSPVWKIGYDQTRVDVPSFQAAATTLLNEQNGISLAIYQSEDAARIIGGILAQIDGVLFEDPATGLIVLKLIRRDYDANLIPVMTVDNTVDAEVTVHGWRETSNAVRVTFNDRSRSYQKNWAMSHRLANSSGLIPRLRAHEVEYTGCTTQALAETLVARDLAVVARPYATANVKLNREFFAILPGDALKANWPWCGIVNKVFRVVDVDYGQLADGTITVALIEDVFGATLGAFPTP
ncbi:MAG: hypothetical protein QOI20_3291 [Acidimicrobiaceae bacterium]|jgi:hypothetical protein|nr:hypothetical protein [Acidimicrobiaceae bacterium]